MLNRANRFFEKKGAFLLVCLLIISLYWIRVINLDQDLPPWGVVLYQPKDEGCYSILAINRMEYDVINPSSPLGGENSYPMYVQEHVRTNLFGNLLAILSFDAFGDNYYGLRLPVVFTGFFSILLTLWTLQLLRFKYGRGTPFELNVIIALILFNIFHFHWYIASRTVEPSIYRMLFVQFTVLIWLLLDKHQKIGFFMLGLVITGSVFLVYITNVFLYLAVLLMLLVIWKDRGFKTFVTNYVCFIAGSLIVLFAANIYYKNTWGLTAIQNTFTAVQRFVGIDGYQISGGELGFFHGVIKGVLKYLSSYFFLYSPEITMVLTLLLPFCLWDIVKKRDIDLCLLLGIPVAFLFQTMVSEDFIWRKLITVTPVFLYLIAWAFFARGEIKETYCEWKKGLCTSKRQTKMTFGRILLSVYPSFAVLLSLFLVFYHLFVTTDKARLDFDNIDKLIIIIFGCIPILFWYVKKITDKVLRRDPNILHEICFLFFSTMLLNLCFLAKYVWIQPSFYERDMQISLSEKYHLDDKYVIGDSVMGITLYNNLKPVYDYHTNYGSRLISNPELVLHHYSNEDNSLSGYFNTEVFAPESEYTALQVETIPSSFQIYGKVRNFGLYKTIRRSELYARSNEKTNKNNLADDIQNIINEIRVLDNDNRELSSDKLNEKREILERELKNQIEKYEAETERSLITKPIYSDYSGNINGDILFEIYGNIYGNVYGNIYGVIYGTIYGNVYGDILSPIEGIISGDVFGNVCNGFEGHVLGDIRDSTQA